MSKDNEWMNTGDEAVRRFTYQRRHRNCSFPRNATPITGRMESGHFTADGPSNWTSPPDQDDAPTTDLNRMLRNVRYQRPLEAIADSIWKGKAMFGTDGSVLKGHATYSFIISTDDTNINADVTGGGHLPPPAQFIDWDSHRLEAAAAYALLTHVSQILHQRQDPRTPGSPTPTILMIIDNESIVKDILRTTDDTTSLFQTLRPNWDIIQGIQHLIDMLPIKVLPTWEKSHQDEGLAWDELTPRAKINVLSDMKATALQEIPIANSGLFPQIIPGTKATLLHGGTPVTKDFSKYVKRVNHDDAMTTYLIDRSHTGHGRDKAWSVDTFHDIDWDSFEAAFKSLSDGRQIQLAKYVHDWTATRRHLNKFDNSVDDRCFPMQPVVGRHQSHTPMRRTIPTRDQRNGDANPALQTCEAAHTSYTPGLPSPWPVEMDARGPDDNPGTATT